MHIQHEDNGKKGIFYIAENNERVAEMTYVWAGEGSIIIDHTLVSEQLKGKGIGNQLVQEAVNFARKLNIKIIPLCPFAKKVFDKTPEFADVLK